MILFRRLIHRHRSDFAFMIFILLLFLLWHKINNYYEHLRFDYEDDDTKYVLIWTPINPIFDKMNITNLKDFNAFLDECEYSNCYFTVDRHFHKLTKFDAIIFSASETDLSILPWVRSPYQKYVLALIESPRYFMRTDLENPVYFINNFFNWTWTYRLNSDILWRYFTIYDKNGKEVGPKINMQWLTQFKPLYAEGKTKLKSKSKAVAWTTSHCATYSQSELYANKLRFALQQYNLSLDSYGECGEKACKNRTVCSEMIKKDYYFYLAFENSFDADYVTEKLLNAIQNSAVPVVLGGANYTRFLPPGSYLDARKLTPKQMAKTMSDIISNSTSYQEYFRWTNYYKYKEALIPELCNLCKALNDEKMVENITFYPDIKRWWTGSFSQAYRIFFNVYNL